MLLVNAPADVRHLRRRQGRRKALQQRRLNPGIIERSGQPDRLCECLPRLSVPTPLELEGAQPPEGVHPHRVICECTRHIRRLHQRLLRLLIPPQLDERAPGIAARHNRATGITVGLTQPLAPEEKLERRQGLAEVQVAQRGEVQSVALALSVPELTRQHVARDKALASARWISCLIQADPLGKGLVEGLGGLGGESWCRGVHCGKMLLLSAESWGEGMPIGIN